MNIIYKLHVPSIKLTFMQNIPSTDSSVVDIVSSGAIVTNTVVVSSARGGSASKRITYC